VREVFDESLRRPIAPRGRVDPGDHTGRRDS
jgi:hypothetical protein